VSGPGGDDNASPAVKSSKCGAFAADQSPSILNGHRIACADRERDVVVRKREACPN
jgi:hypothetical protein